LREHLLGVLSQGKFFRARSAPREKTFPVPPLGSASVETKSLTPYEKNPVKTIIGYTLLEILIVLSLFSVIASFALPAISQLLQDANENAVRLQLIKSISDARLQSIYRHATISLCAANESQQCGTASPNQLVIFLNPAQESHINNKEQIIAYARLMHHAGSLHWRAYPKYRDYLLFYNDEFPLNDNATIWDCHQSSRFWAITLSQMGQTQILLPNKSGEILDAHGKPLPC
jgi:type IV fimbrial biogenesis protein FimT